MAEAPPTDSAEATSPGQVFILDPTGVCRYASPATALVGKPVQAGAGFWGEAGLPEWFSAYVLGAGRAARETGTTVETTHRVTQADNACQQLHCRVTPMGLTSDQGLVVQVARERTAGPADRSQGHAPPGDLVPATATAVVRVPDWHLLHADTGLRALLRWCTEGPRAGGLLTAFERPDDPVRIAETVRRSGAVVRRAVRLVDTAGAAVDARLCAAPMDARGSTILLVLQSTARGQHHGSRLDYGGRDALRHRLHRARRAALTHGGGVALLRVNAYAHGGSGLAPLSRDSTVAVLDRLRHYLPRAGDVAALGEGTFGVVLERLRHPLDAERVAHYLRRLIRDSGAACVHIGTAVALESGVAPARLLTGADRALAQAGDDKEDQQLVVADDH